MDQSDDHEVEVMYHTQKNYLSTAKKSIDLYGDFPIIISVSTPLRWTGSSQNKSKPTNTTFERDHPKFKRKEKSTKEKGLNKEKSA